MLVKICFYEGIKCLWVFAKKTHVREKSRSRIISIIMSKLDKNRCFRPFSRVWVIGSVRYRILCKYKMGRSICKRTQVLKKSHFCIISIIRRQNMSKIETFWFLSHFSRIWVIESVRYRILCKYKMGGSICKRPQIPEKTIFCIISIIIRKNRSKIECFWLWSRFFQN